MTSNPFAGLQPAALWKHFEAFTKVARPSGQEEKAAAYVEGWAKERGLKLRKDKVGNLCVYVPATPGREKAPPVVLQGHLDMVCERNADSPYDAERGNLHVVREGDWITAQGTTLGADNGIGVAAAMGVAEDPSVVHGPLELLMTLDEETGMTGAMGLDASMLSGRVLLNLDSEEDGALTVGCAGGLDTRMRMPFEREPAPAGHVALGVSVGGLQGGHSGLDIHKNRMNAIQALARMLQAGESEAGNMRLLSFDGGSKRNAIPREAVAVVVLDPSRVEAFQAGVKRAEEELRKQYAGLEDKMAVSFASEGKPGPTLPQEAGRRLLSLLRAMPSGVVAMSQDIPGLVETSTNLGVLSTSDTAAEIICCNRSSVAPALRNVADTLRNVGRLAGAEVAEHGGYPGWKPDMESAILALTRSTHERLFGKLPHVEACHAGLECGLIGERLPGMDMVSFGPTITGAHSPDEQVHIPSVARFWKLLGAVLDELSS